VTRTPDSGPGRQRPGGREPAKPGPAAGSLSGCRAGSRPSLRLARPRGGHRDRLSLSGPPACHGLPVAQCWRRASLSPGSPGLRLTRSPGPLPGGGVRPGPGAGMSLRVRLGVRVSPGRSDSHGRRPGLGPSRSVTGHATHPRPGPGVTEDPSHHVDATVSSESRGPPARPEAPPGRAAAPEPGESRTHGYWPPRRDESRSESSARPGADSESESGVRPRRRRGRGRPGRHSPLAGRPARGQRLSAPP
jgi:hypothetical protein